MKLRNVAFVSFLLCTPAAFASLDKGNTKEYTDKGMGYSALALTNGLLCLERLYRYSNKEDLNFEMWFNWTITSWERDNIIPKLFILNSVLAPAIIAISDAKTAWHYFQKAFSRNKISPPSSFTAEKATAVTTKWIHIAKLLGYAGFMLMNINEIAVRILNTEDNNLLGLPGLANMSNFLHADDINKPVDFDFLLRSLLYIQASARLAFYNFKTMKDHYTKAFPKDILKKDSSITPKLCYPSHTKETSLNKRRLNP